MFKKAFLCGTVGALILSFLLLPGSAFSADFYVYLMGVNFTVEDTSVDFVSKGRGTGSLYINQTLSSGARYYYHPVYFETSGYFNSMAIDFIDNRDDAYVTVTLRRLHFPSGTIQIVSTFTTNGLTSSSSYQKAYVGNEAGMRPINIDNFAYWVHVDFYGGDPSQLGVRSIRIKYNN